MKIYLSFGGGVNSVAEMFLLKDEGWDFEAVYVDHGCDWPETHAYIKMLQDNGHRITIIKPSVQGVSNLYDYCWRYRMVPSRVKRWCTDKFKVRPLIAHFEKPCFNCIAFDTDEAHRAKLKSKDGEEMRFPLLEYGLSRADCKNLIKEHGFPVPIKSGCWFCPFQRVGQWRKLRKDHPDLYCKAKALEDRNVTDRIARGKKPIYLVGKKPLDVVVQEAQHELWEDMRPPCYCTR